MFHVVDTATDEFGNGQKFWQVEIYDIATSAVIPIFADYNGTIPIATVSFVANRAVADLFGNIDFYVSPGTYGKRYYNAAGVLKRTVPGLDMYGAGATLTNAPTRTAAIAATVPVAVNSILTAGYAAAGDLGGALYKRVGSAPAHAGKFQSADGAWWELAEAVVTPQMFGAAGDALWNAATNTATGTNDRTACQAAIDFFQLRGVAGTVSYTRLHRINTVVAQGAAMNAGLSQYGNGICHRRDAAGLVGLVFDASAGTANYRGFHLSGGGKVSDDVTVNRCIDKAGYTPTATIAENATSITLSAGAGANFAAGDMIFIRTGQLLTAGSGRSGLTEPDSELNWVDSVAGDTLSLRYPAMATYAQEYFVAGTVGLTTTSVTANLARFEVANVQDRVLNGAHFDIDLIGHNTLQVLNIWGAVNLSFAPTATLIHGANGVGSRDSRFVDWNARILHTARINGFYFFAPSTGCAEWSGALYGRSPRGSAFFHFHEAVKKSRFCSVDAAVKGTGLINGLIDILARCGELRFDNVLLDTGTANGAVIVVGSVADVAGEYCDGRVSFGSVAHRNANTGGSAILVNGANVSFDTEPVALGAHDRLSNVTYTRNPTYGIRVGNQLSGPFLFDRQLVLGSLAQDAVLERVTEQVVSAFAAGDRRMRLGFSGTMNAYVNDQVINTLVVNNVSQIERGVTTIDGVAGTNCSGSSLGLAQSALRTIVAEINAGSGTTDYTAGTMRVTARISRSSRVS